MRSGHLPFLLAAPLATALLSPLRAADLPVLDLYASIGTAAGWEIEETSTAPGGATTIYEWAGGDDHGLALAVGVLGGRAYAWGGIVAALEATAGQQDITPESYDVGGVGFANTSASELQAKSVGGRLYAGYEYGMDADTEGITGYVLVMPFIGGGLLWADNELHAGGSYERKRGRGSYWEAGLRLAGFLTERRWTFGVAVDWAVGEGRVTMDFPGVYQSELELDRNGAAVTGIAGYRF